MPIGKLAAVLLPFHYDEEQRLNVSVIRRAVGGPHSGQLAFPGGKYESSDTNMLETALRETEEEVGLSREEVTVVGPLTPIHTIHTGFTIYPFIGLLKSEPDIWVIEETEVQEVLTIRIDDLLPTHHYHLVNLPEKDKPTKFPCYYIDQHPLWGASYRIIKPLMNAYSRGELDF